MARAVRLALTLVLVSGMAGCARSGAAEEPPPAEEEATLPVGRVAVRTGDGAWVRLRVELATTPETQARGLMYRESLDDGEGMLFVFPDDRVRAFWMKNTYIPLDMLFIDADGVVVGVVHQAEPLTTDRRSVGLPSRYVLEVPGGWARSRGVDAGSRVRFEGIPGVAEPFGGDAAGDD